MSWVGRIGRIAVIVGGWAPSAAHAGKDFAVDFGACTEFAGIGFAPAANVAALVPPGYALAGNGTSAVVVVRVASCADVSINGGNGAPGVVAQIGATIVGPDTAADIDNYTLWYVTDSGALHGKLTAAGVPSVLDANLSYAFVPDGSGSGAFDIAVTPSQGPSYEVSGSAVEPTSTPVPFVARWWYDGPHGVVTMATDLPAIAFSSASMVLSTDAGSALAALFGSPTATFALLDSYNAFDEAHMEVTVD